MKKILIVMILLLAIIVLAFPVDPLNNSEITITPENTIVTKQMGTGIDKKNSKIIRRLSVTLDGVEAKGDITPAHSDKNLLMIRTEDSPLIMITEQIDNKSGEFFMSFSGSLDSVASGTGGGTWSSTPSFLGKAVGGIECIAKPDSMEQRVILKYDIFLNSLSDTFYNISCPVDGNKTLDDLAKITKKAADYQFEDVQEDEYREIYGYYAFHQFVNLSKSRGDDDICSVCTRNSVGAFTCRVFYDLTLPYILLPQWNEYSNASESIKKEWDIFLKELKTHEIKHHLQAKEYFIDKIYAIDFQHYLCKHADDGRYSKLLMGCDEVFNKQIQDVIKNLENDTKEFLRVFDQKSYELDLQDAIFPPYGAKNLKTGR